MKSLALCVVAQPTTVWNAINEQFVHAYLPVRGNVEGHCTLSATNRLLERWAGVFLNEKLAPLINHLATKLRITGRVRGTAFDLILLANPKIGFHCTTYRFGVCATEVNYTLLARRLSRSFFPLILYNNHFCSIK
jgi:hypothetical protein